MEMRKLGNITVSAVGLGCNNFGMACDAAQTAHVVSQALDSGITFFDTADVYGNGRSEEYLGQALRGKRDKAVIATKFGMRMGKDADRSGASARWIATAIEDSLRRLNTDYVDLYQLHQPDNEVAIDETLEACNRLVESGKVRAIGCSNFTGAQIEAAASASAKGKWASFISVQNHLSLLNQETLRDIRASCVKNKLGVLPYFPLESGVLTGKYQRDKPLPKDSRLGSERAAAMRDRFLSDRAKERAEALGAFAEARGHTLLELAFAWLLAEPLVSSVIAGATRPAQVTANVNAAIWRLTADEVAQAGAIGRGASH